MANGWLFSSAGTGRDYSLACLPGVLRRSIVQQSVRAECSRKRAMAMQGFTKKLPRLSDGERQFDTRLQTSVGMVAQRQRCPLCDQQIGGDGQTKPRSATVS